MKTADRFGRETTQSAAQESFTAKNRAKRIRELGNIKGGRYRLHTQEEPSNEKKFLNLVGKD